MLEQFLVLIIGLPIIVFLIISILIYIILCVKLTIIFYVWLASIFGYNVDGWKNSFMTGFKKRLWLDKLD